MCSNKINAICSTYRFYERTAGIELGSDAAPLGGGEVVRIKEGRKAVNRQVASGKVDRVKGALLSRSLAFGSVLFNEHFLSRSTPRQSRAFTAETLDTAWKARRIALLPFRELKYTGRMGTTSYADRHSSKERKGGKKRQLEYFPRRWLFNYLSTFSVVTFDVIVSFLCSVRKIFKFLK